MADKRPAHEIAKQALYMYIHRDNYAYLYGTDGQTGTDELVDKMVRRHAKHFEKFSHEDIQRLKDYVRGKTCYDCSGFVHTLFGSRDLNSFGIISDCDVLYNLPEQVTESPEATVLYKPGHIGVDTGHGTFVHIAAEFQTFRFERIREYDWTLAGEWNKFCDYTDAYNY